MAYYRCIVSGGSGDFPVTLTVTCDPAFVGETLYLTKGLTVLSKTVPATGIVEFEFPESGTWVLSNSLTSDTETFENVGEYETNLYSVPDGKTVLPTDDIQIWLSCAGIRDKDYTTLAEVLADTTTLLALINSPNAVDYMVRSTTWAVAITVPLMTSNTTPSGICSESASYGYPPYLAFDRDTSTKWVYGGSGTTAWIQYQFPNAITLAKMTFKGNIDTPYLVPSQIVVKGSNDGNTFTDLKTITGISADSSEHEISINANTPYAYYRLECTARSYGGAYYAQFSEIQFYSVTICDNSTAMSYIGLNNYCANTLLADSTWKTAICLSEYKTSVLNVKVPAMTSDTTPSGTVIYNAQYPVGNKYGYYAFDGNESTGWYENQYGKLTAGDYIGYQFPSAVKCYVAEILIGRGTNPRNQKFKYQSSVAGDTLSSWNDISEEITVYTDVDNKVTTVLNNDQSNVGYCAYFTFDPSYSTTTSGVMELQFYGREDV